MRVRSFSGFGELDVGGTVVQMDQITWELKSALSRAQSSWHLMFTADQADAVNGRLAAIAGTIRELDVGGAGREHVFFPLPGQSQDEAWATYRSIAESTRASLADLGQFVNQWSLTSTLPRIGADIKHEVSSDTTWIAVGVGALVLLSLASTVGHARRAFSGYSRARRRR